MLESENLVNRGGVYYSFNSVLRTTHFDFQLGTGFQWGNVVKNQFYSPQINAGIHYGLLQKDKLDVHIGLRYLYSWRRYPFNTQANNHSLYYGYKLTYGSKLFLSHHLGVGGMMRSDFPYKHRAMLDVILSIGIGYAF